MSIWKDAFSTVRQITLLQYKVDEAITLGKEARQHSIENRDRITRIESLLDYALARSRDETRQKRLPPD